jgi:hypothetical protein
MSTTQKIIYNGFYIKDEIYKTEIDTFLQSLIIDDNECYVLKHFWKKNCPRIDLPYMNLDMREELLFSLIDNETLWKKFNKLIDRHIKPHEQILALPEMQEQIIKCEKLISKKIYDIEICIDLKPLNEFSYWLKLLNILFISVIRELFNQIKISETKIEKCILIKRLIVINLRCMSLITNKYAYNDLSYSNTQIKKIMSFFDEGLEFALYSFGIIYPNLVNDNIYPIINSSAMLYHHPELTICLDDPIFGNAKTQFYKYY